MAADFIISTKNLSNDDYDIAPQISALFNMKALNLINKRRGGSTIQRVISEDNQETSELSQPHDRTLLFI